ncbi:MAG: hypothetical protein AAGJ84_11695 [Pseudomonadota bacterium]
MKKTLRAQRVAGVCVIFAAASAAAQETDPASIDAIFACTPIEDALERVACYDAAVGRFQQAEDAGEVTVIAKSEVEELNREAFGFRLPSLPSFTASRNSGAETPNLDQIIEPVSQVVRLSSSRNLRVALENGQIWEQTDGKRVQYSARVGVESAEIQRAALGSYKMKLDGGPAFRVKRIQ